MTISLFTYIPDFFGGRDQSRKSGDRIIFANSDRQTAAVLESKLPEANISRAGGDRKYIGASK